MYILILYKIILNQIKILSYLWIIFVLGLETWLAIPLMGGHDHSICCSHFSSIHSSFFNFHISFLHFLSLSQLKNKKEEEEGEMIRR